MIKAIIFDFDGVLVESVDIKTKAFAKLFESERKEIVEKIVDYHLKNAGVSRFEKFRYIYKEILERELTDEIFKALCKRFSELVVDEVVNAPYVKGAKEFLDAYSVVYDCYIASATPQEEIEEIIKRRNMMRYFKGIYGSPKKKVDIVREILTVNTSSLSPQSSVLSPYPSILPTQSSPLSPQSFVYVGDALSDYEATKDNLVNFIARINDNESIFANIDCIKVKDLCRLAEVIKELAKA
ncbi:haloacid dehalogenase [Dissulfurispira thermophila]|uniref:phosphoglycolate phosphatase n=2 Tax=root TaxID=1 RepID=A0A7G1H264_9BACT|nr:HAD hydrolase-like protein [Dissulfurispira thermophila]BCB96312.1 haloacid dehalogenase [Dissulfurispira thermophila]